MASTPPMKQCSRCAAGLSQAWSLQAERALMVLFTVRAACNAPAQRSVAVLQHCCPTAAATRRTAIVWQHAIRHSVAALLLLQLLLLLLLLLLRLITASL
jgi:hypothetical protein